MSESSEKLSILIVEDDEATRLIYKNILEEGGYSVLEAQDGGVAWALVQSHNPALILLDLFMPKMEGFDVIKRMRWSDSEKLRHMPIIVLSIAAERRNVGEALAMGADDFLVKGAHAPSDVLDKIKDALAPHMGKNPRTSYRVALTSGTAEASKLQYEMRLSGDFSCRRCGNGLLLEMFDDTHDDNSRWFHAHFVCPKCKQAI